MITKNDLQKWYVKDKKSLQQIATAQKCSLNKIQYWMKKYGLRSRSRSDALYARYNPNGDPFRVKKTFNKNDFFLLGLGLGLWWGEGSKMHKGTIRLGNTDPSLIKKFILFLTDIFGVDKNKIRFGLQIFSDMEPAVAKKFWIKSLDVTDDQFFPKIVVNKSIKLGTYHRKIQHGVLTVYCSNIKLRQALDSLFEKYAAR